MALTYLVDTSVLSRLRTPEVRSRVEGLSHAGDLHVGRLSLLELGSSARSKDEWDGIQRACRAFSIVEVVDEDYEQALVTQRDLAEKGRRGRQVPDLLIAASAARTHAAVLHYDRDFEHIAEVTGQATEWVVALGTVD